MTRPIHAELEARLPLIDPGLSRPTYRDIVARFFGFYAPLEAGLLGPSSSLETGVDYVQRRKVSRLETDLAALGCAEVAELPRCAELPRLDSVQRVLGCLYVIEGATLGGQVITRHLEKNLGITPESGGAFFAGYGAETGPRWKEFCALLTAAAERVGGEDEIVAGANETFATLGRWLFPDASFSNQITP